MSVAQATDQETRKWWVLANVAVGTFMATLDGSIANVGLPTISNTLQVPLHLVQWVVTAYLLTICAMLPLVGNLADLWGRGRLYNAGFLVFAAGSTLCALSPTISLLIASRIAQALGAALLMANSQAITATIFPQHQRGRALGIIGATVSLGALTGPTIGGLLIGYFNWSAIFWVNVPIGVLGFVLGLFLLPKKHTRQSASGFDYMGTVLFIVGIVGLLYTVSNGETWTWTSSRTVVGLTGSILVLAAFGVRERYAKKPMIDFSLYRNRAFSAASFAAMLSFVSLFCTNTMMPFYLEDVLHASPQVTGLAMMTYPLAMAGVAPLSGYISDRIGPKLLTTGGLCVNALGFVLLNLLSTGVQPWVVGLHLVLFGIGQGMFQSPNNANIMNTAPRSKVGLVGGLNALVRNIGMVIGISLSVSVFTVRLHQLTGAVFHGVPAHLAPGLFMAALHTVFWAAAAVCVAGAVSSVLRVAPRRQVA
ncbi:MFS transporter [Alicyclobacillus sp. ALC3]|uniref:MFS transporter n=1 Tax=Alicyclobacillus sp. ALC3 TaxID=2796143 RepID=UPI002378BED2|nr:MFS transporter [Alicyclobacillus sp. ALC3]WDL95540.1 MFS transporter [Alicyclobacillus sp. ALC3]